MMMSRAPVSRMAHSSAAVSVSSSAPLDVAGPERREMMDAGHVRAESVQSRPNRIRQTILGAEQDHVTRRIGRDVTRRIRISPDDRRNPTSG
jgi:hypothetical protein